MKKGVLETAVFCCGASTMILELTGSRVLAPYVGTSIYVWTSLIGVILGALSLGYWWGGILADYKPSFRQLSLIIFIAATEILSSDGCLVSPIEESAALINAWVASCKSV